MALKILDASKYQSDIDYGATASDCSGVILRAGLTYWGAQNMGIDPCFEKHYAGFKAVGLPVGAYYYSAADSVAVAEKEADYFLSLLKGKQFELPVYYDVENNQRQGGLSKELLTQIVDAFCAKVQAAGYYVGFYASTSWLQNKMDTAALSKKYTLWKADYRDVYDKTIACDIHQYTSQGRIAGINGDVDLNYCYKNFVSIIKSNGLNGFAPQEVEDTTIEGSARLVIGPISKGDIKTMSEYLDSLEIRCEINTEGYIITAVEVSAGDVKNIIGKADEIGNVPVNEYVVDTSKPEACAECDLLAAEIEKLKKQLKEKDAELAAEHDAKVHAQQQADKLLNQVENLQVEKQSAVDALHDAEQRAQNYYSQMIEANKEADTLSAEVEALKTEVELYENREEEESAASLLFRLLRKIFQGG